MVRFATKCLAALTTAVTFAVVAQEFPSKPIRLIVGNTPGSALDVVGRMYAAKLGEKLRQQVVVENRPGATELIASNALLQAEPDGHTIMWTSAGFPALPVMMKSLPFDIRKDFAPIAMVAANRLVLIGSLKAPFKTLDEMIEYVKANPGKANLAVGGGGGALLLAYWLNFGTGSKFELVRYAGSPQAMQSVMTGDSHVFIQAISAAKQAAEAGKVRILGFTGTQRSPELSSVPAFTEAKSPELSELAKNGFGYTWMGVLASARVPRIALSVLTDQTLAVSKDPDFARQLQKFYFFPEVVGPDAFAQHIAKEAGNWRSLAHLITPQ